MKKYLLIAVLLLCGTVASGQTITRRQRSGATLPASCRSSTNVVEIFILKSGVAGNDGDYWCNAGAWVKTDRTRQTFVALTDAATIATNANLGNKFRVTLGGNRTLGNPTNATDGQQLIYEIIQDGTGTRTITLDTKFALGTDITAVTLTTTINKRDFLTVIYNSTADKFYVVGFVKGY